MNNYFNNRDRQEFFGNPPGGFFGMPFFPPGMIQGPGGFPGPGMFPGQGPGGFPPPFAPPFGGGPGGGPPSGPPPSFIPSQAAAQQTVGVYAVDPGAIRRCLFRYVYLWLVNGQQFWAWLTFVGGRSVAGWRWTGFNWVYFGIDLNQISAFVCY